jgi:hypothetical protein
MPEVFRKPKGYISRQVYSEIYTSEVNFLSSEKSCDFCGRILESGEISFLLRLQLACFKCASNDGNYTVTVLRTHTKRPRFLRGKKRKYSPDNAPTVKLDYGYNHGRRTYANWL